MKKRTLLILVYTLVITALVASVKVVKTYANHDQAVHACLLADCGDPNPSPTPGE